MTAGNWILSNVPGATVINKPIIVTKKAAKSLKVPDIMENIPDTVGKALFGVLACISIPPDIKICRFIFYYNRQLGSFNYITKAGRKKQPQQTLMNKYYAYNLLTFCLKYSISVTGVTYLYKVVIDDRS